MADAWPAELPQKLHRDDFEESLGDNVVRSQTETGPGKVRRRSTAAAGTIDGSMTMTTEQWVALVGADRRSGFFGTTLLSGSLPFIFPDPSGTGTLLCRFASPPARRAVSVDQWSVRLSLEVLP